MVPRAWSDKVFNIIIGGAILWATWTTVQLYQIKQDLAVVVSRMEKVEKNEMRIEMLEAAVWPRNNPAWRK